MKTDIAKYFESVDHEVLKDMLYPTIRGAQRTSLGQHDEPVVCDPLPLQDGRHTLTLHSGSAQVGKVTLTALNSTAGKGDTPQNSSSGGCNNGLGLGSFGLLFAGAALLRKKQ